MLEYMRKIDVLRQAPGAEAINHPHKQLKLATFFCPLNQNSSQETTTSFQTPGKTFQGLVLAKTVSAHLNLMGNSEQAKGGANLGSVWSCGRAQNNPLGEGVGVNWGSPEGQGKKRKFGGQGQSRDDKNCEGQRPAISVTKESAKLEPVQRPDEEGDEKTSRCLKKVSP